MSSFSGGGDFEPIILELLVHADEATFRRAMSRVEAMVARSTKAMQQEWLTQAKIALKIQERITRDEQDQHRRRAATRATNARRDRARLKEEDDHRKKLAKAAERRFKNRERQEKQADRLEVQRDRHATRMAEIASRNRGKIREQELRKERVQVTARGKIREQELRKERAQVTAHGKLVAVTEQGRQQRSIVRTAAFYRTLANFARQYNQAALHALQNFWARRHARRMAAHQREASDSQGHQNRLFGILRRGNSRREAEVSRSAIRQQGVVAASQRQMETGIFGSLRRMRGLLLAGGGYLSVRTIFGPVAEFEQTKIAFEGMLGSAEKASSFLKELQQFSAKTPFDFTGLAESARQLLGVGFAADDVVPVMERIGGVAASLGVGTTEIRGVIRALGQMKGKGKASAEELQQISEQIPGFSAIDAIAKQLGITTAEAFKQMEAGAIPADVAIQAMLAGMEEFPGAAGAMERQSRTLNGRLETLKDTFQILVIDLTEGLVPILADAIGLFTQFFESLFRGSGAWKIVRDGLGGLAIGLGSILALRGAVQVVQLLRIGLIGLAQAALAHPFVTFVAVLGTVLFPLIRNNAKVAEFFGTLVDSAKELAATPLETVTEAWKALLDLDFAGAAQLAGEAGSSLIGLVQGAIQSAVGWITSDGVRQFVGAWVELLRASASLAFALAPDVFAVIGDWLWVQWSRAYEAVKERLTTFDWGKWGLPIVAAIGAALAIHFTSLPIVLAGAFATAVIASSPKWREAIGNILPAIGERLREVGPTVAVAIIGGLYYAARFITGPLLETIFSETGLKIMGVIAGGVIAGTGALVLGLVDGLRQSVPEVISNLKNILNPVADEFGRVIGEITGFGPIVEVALSPLMGIIPTLELFARVLSYVPGPVYAVVVAVTALHFAFSKFKKSKFGKQLIPFLQGFVAQVKLIPTRVQLAGLALQRFGQDAQFAANHVSSVNATFRNQGKAMGGSVTGMRLLGSLSVRAGTAISAVGAALPAIGMAAMIGLPIALGLWEKAKARTAEWKNEVKQLGQALRDHQGDIESFVKEEMIRNAEGLADALNELGDSASQFARTAASPSTRELGDALLDAMPRADEFRAALSDAGVSIEEFGAAAAEGDRAVRGLFGSDATEMAQEMGAAWAEIPEPVRDTIDQLNEAAEAELAVAFASGELTRSQQRIFRGLSDGTDTTHTWVGLLDSWKTGQDRARISTEEHEKEMERFREAVDRAYESTSFFRDQINLLAGDGISLRKAQIAVEESTADLFAKIAEGGVTFQDVEGDLVNLADQMLQTVDVINNEDGVVAANRAYAQFREQLVNTAAQFFDTREQAERYVAQTLRIPPRAVTRAILEDLEARQALAHLKETIDRLRMEGTLKPIRILAEVQIDTTDWDRFASQVSEIASALGTSPAALGFTGSANPFLGAEGGIFTQPTPMIIGEDGPEVLLPLSKPARLAELMQQAGLANPQATGGNITLAPQFDPTATEQQLTILRQWATEVDKILLGVVASFDRTGTQIMNTVDRWTAAVVADFGRMLTELSRMAVTGGTAVVNSMKRVLTAGTTEVARIVRGYARSLKESLDPLLVAIGEPKINLQASERGNINQPRIARPGDGAQVHVFNEGQAGRYGEAYIPFQPSNRGRSRQIATETVSRLGGRVQWFQEGGITTPLPNLTGNWRGLNPLFATRLSTWATTLGEPYNVRSGYRSIAEQARLYQAYLAGVGNLAAPPGASLHNFGLAADGPSWGHRGPGRFRMHYNVPGEPWHVEPIEGRALASGEYGAFGDIQPLAKPPSAGKRGVLSETARALMQHVYDAALDYAGQISVQAAAPNLTGGPTPEIMAAIRQAMRIVGVPATWLGPLLTLIGRESGFNPRAANTTPAGIAAGSPRGLMQIVAGTFAAHALPGYGNVFNPLHNVIAGLRYILSRYGTIFNVGQAVNPSPTGGYRYGGVVNRDGMYRIAEGNRPEAIIPLTNTARAISLMRETGLDQLIGGSLVDSGPTVAPRTSTTTSATTSTIPNAGPGSPIVGTMIVNSQATDPEVVAQKVATKLGRSTRRIGR